MGLNGPPFYSVPRYQEKLMPICALCKSDTSRQESHIIPHFVFERIKNNSPTGYLRGGLVDVDLRRQDGDKAKLLCGDCEQRFSPAEREFAERIFTPYHESGMTSFEYGPWLSYLRYCQMLWMKVLAH